MAASSQGLWRETYALIKPFRFRMLAAAALGIASGLSTTALLATLNLTLNAADGPNSHLIATFAGLCLLVMACSTSSNLIINYIGQHIILQLRQRLAKQVLLAPITQLEQFRSHRLIPILVNDVGTISQFVLDIAPLIVSFAITVGCLSYLAYLSWQVLLLTLLTVAIGSFIQYLAHRFGKPYLDEARNATNDLQKLYETLSSAAKEFRIQRQRRFQMFFNQIPHTTQRICQANIRSTNIFISAGVFGSILFFLVIGIAIVYQTLWPSIDKTMLSGFVLVMLYMKAPLEHMVTTLPNITRAQIAFQRITKLSKQFLSPEPRLLTQAVGQPEEKDIDAHSPTGFSKLQLKGISYAFPAIEDVSPFRLGPIDLDIHAGEIMFIVGENGCGKTTLIKLLLGLYSPQQGQILLNGQPVTDESLDDYRQLFTTIFSDYHLFEELIQERDHLPEQALTYLQRMDIAHKVGIRDGAFTTTDLSTGQRKRLALVNAWLENRSILVFDEWAADQDPTFRRIFYTELLPDLKQLGKTIIVISHDDRYFTVADKLIQLDQGKIMEDTLVTV